MMRTKAYKRRILRNIAITIVVLVLAGFVTVQIMTLMLDQM